jgi:hypothetical protein
MTTQDQHTGTNEFATAPADFVDGQADTQPPVAAEATPVAAETTPVAAESTPQESADGSLPPVAATEATPEPTPTDDALFAESDLSDLRSRWNDVQATFVDDPKDCVTKADSLVSDAVDQLTSSFSHARSRLEEQWAKGEEASTEDLRVALKRYRDFFDRLLAV